MKHPDKIFPRPMLRDVVRTVYIYFCLWSALILYIFLAGPFLLIAVHTFDRHRKLPRKLAKLSFPNLIAHFCFLDQSPLIISQLAALQSIGPCIVVANHGSIMDSVLLMALPKNIGDGRIWAKNWPFRIPLLGWLMRLSGHLFVEDFNILPDARSCLIDGSSLLVFPESSRTRSGKLGRFRDGAFLLAARTGRPIVPVAIHGAFDCLPPKQPWIFFPHLRVEPLAVLHPDPTDPKTALHLRQQAHALLATALAPKAAPLTASSAPAAA